MPKLRPRWQGLGSNDDIPRLHDPAFRVDDYPEGFSEAKRSVNRKETLVRCDCGQEFYLL
jgi:hypothetical protein